MAGWAGLQGAGGGGGRGQLTAPQRQKNAPPATLAWMNSKSGKPGGEEPQSQEIELLQQPPVTDRSVVEAMLKLIFWTGDDYRGLPSTPTGSIGYNPLE